MSSDPMKQPLVAENPQDQRQAVLPPVQPAQYGTVVGPQIVTVPAIGNCPNCRVGNIIESFSSCGIAAAICCFPLGLICLLNDKEKKCSHCGQEF